MNRIVQSRSGQFRSPDQRKVPPALERKPHRPSPGHRRTVMVPYLQEIDRLKRIMIPDGEPDYRVPSPDRVHRTKSGRTQRGYYSDTPRPIKFVLNFPRQMPSTDPSSPDGNRSVFQDERLFLLLMKPAFIVYVSDKMGREVRWEPDSRTLTIGRKKSEHRRSRHDTVHPGRAFLDNLDARLRRWHERNRSSKKAKRRPNPVPVHSRRSGSMKHAHEAPLLTETTIGNELNPENMSIEDRLVLLLALFAQKMMEKLESKVGSLGHSRGSETQKQAEIQLLTQKLTRAIQTLSQVMRAFHEAMTTSIRNIR